MEAIAWGAFFVRIGIVLLAGIPAEWALAVIGIITLSAQAGRGASGVRYEGFRLVVGALATTLTISWSTMSPASTTSF